MLWPGESDSAGHVEVDASTSSQGRHLEVMGRDDCLHKRLRHCRSCSIDRLDNMSAIDILPRMEFRPPSYFALAALIDGPLHGYAIARRAGELSDGAVRLSTGTLYALLERALEEDLVVAGDVYVAGGRRRRDYALTPAGRLALQAESQRLERSAKTVAGRLRATARLAAS